MSISLTFLPIKCMHDSCTFRNESLQMNIPPIQAGLSLGAKSLNTSYYWHPLFPWFRAPVWSGKEDSSSVLIISIFFEMRKTKHQSVSRATKLLRIVRLCKRMLNNGLHYPHIYMLPGPDTQCYSWIEWQFYKGKEPKGWYSRLEGTGNQYSPGSKFLTSGAHQTLTYWHNKWGCIKRS